MGRYLMVQRAVKENSITVKYCWAQHVPVVWPHSLLAVYYSLVLSSAPRACAGPKAVVVGNEEVGVPDELVRAQHTVISSEILASWRMASMIRPMSGL
jgi:hypothetical protein